MLSVIPKFTCPFCMGRYEVPKLEFVCPEGHVSHAHFLKIGKLHCKMPGCAHIATVCRCPSCGETIPQEIVSTPNLPFSIVGVSNAGKTNYITMMLHELSRSPGLKLALGAKTTYTRIIQTDRYQNLKNNHQLAENTNSEIKPQIWYIKNLEKKRGSIVPTYTFTIFDGAGEDQEKRMDPSDPVCRYIGISEAVILVLDPLTLPSVRRTVNPTVLANSMGSSRARLDETEKDSQDIVNSVARYIKIAYGLPEYRLLNIPVAVVLTKFDTILNHSAFSSQALIRESSRIIQNGRFNNAELEQVNSEIQVWLEDIGERSFLNALRANFKRFYCFGVSSFGSEPDQSNRLRDDPKPHRVLDPIMWLFHIKSFID